MNKRIALEHLKCNVYLLSKCLGTIICIFWKEVVNSLGSTQCIIFFNVSSTQSSCGTFNQVNQVLLAIKYMYLLTLLLLNLKQIHYQQHGQKIISSTMFFHFQKSQNPYRLFFHQINIFCHQLANNMMTSFVRFTKIYTNCFEIQYLQNLCFEFLEQLANMAGMIIIWKE